MKIELNDKEYELVMRSLSYFAFTKAEDFGYEKGTTGILMDRFRKEKGQVVIKR